MLTPLFRCDFFLFVSCCNWLSSPSKAHNWVSKIGRKLNPLHPRGIHYTLKVKGHRRQSPESDIEFCFFAWTLAWIQYIPIFPLPIHKSFTRKPKAHVNPNIDYEARPSVSSRFSSTRPLVSTVTVDGEVSSSTAPGTLLLPGLFISSQTTVPVHSCHSCKTLRYKHTLRSQNMVYGPYRIVRVPPLLVFRDRMSVRQGTDAHRPTRGLFMADLNSIWF